MPNDLITTERDDDIAVVAVDRPKTRNAMDIETRIQLRDSLTAVVDDDNVNAIIITGVGETFISGSDIRLFKEMDPFDAKDYTEYTQGLYDYVESIPKPVIAAIKGYAMGGGLEISMCCDLRVATEGAQLGQSELAIGAIPGGGGTQRLPRMVGMGVAKELMFTGNPMDAERAYQLGLVNRLTDDDPVEAAKEICEEITQHSPKILSMLKEVVNKGHQTDLHSGLNLERYMWSLVFATEDVTEGVDAFLENREPNYQGK